MKANSFIIDRHVIHLLVHNDFRCCIKTPPNVRRGKTRFIAKRSDDKINGFNVRLSGKENYDRRQHEMNL